MISCLLRTLCVLIALTTSWYAHFASAQEREKKEPPPPIGRMIDLGGYKLHLYCAGKGKPTVVLSVGAGAFSTDWALVQPKVAAFTMVGQSLGGMVGRIFTERYPADVEGVVLVDSYSEDAQLFTNGAMRRMSLRAKDRQIFDGFQEILSSVESRDAAKARSVWKQSAKLVGLSEENEEQPSPAMRQAIIALRDRGPQLSPE
jgi:hypothetical protein